MFSSIIKFLKSVQQKSVKKNHVYVANGEDDAALERAALHRIEKTIIVSFQGQLITVSTMLELFWIIRRMSDANLGFNPMTMSFTVACRGQILNRTKSLLDYNLSDVYVNELQVMYFALQGGGNVVSKEVVTSESVKIENRLIHNPKVPVEALEMELQAGATESDWTPDDLFWKIAKEQWTKLVNSWRPTSDKQVKARRKMVVETVENVFLSWHYFWRANDAGEMYWWATLVCRLFTGKTLTTHIQDKFFTPEEVQSLESGDLQGSFGDGLKSLRAAFTATEAITDHPVVKKFVKLYMYLLTQGLLAKMGLKLNDEDYSKLEQRTMTIAYSSKKGLWMAAFDVILFLLEKSYEFYETKDISVFAQTSSEYSSWLKECDRLISLEDFTGNLEAHGTTHFQFLSDLNDTIERGQAYVKYTMLHAGVESTFARKKLGQLQLLKARQITVKDAQKERRAPFGVLLHGSSGVGKSTFRKLLYYYFGQLRGLPTDDHYMYCRGPLDPYYTNFHTSMWCIVLDDIAFLNPNKSSDIDPTLQELLNVCNNVPFVAMQAALEDKGKTPVRAELVIGTSNSEDLNAQEYFWCPLAVQRRLGFVITIKPKQQYQDSRGMLDPKKLDPVPTEFPDYWDIYVRAIKRVLKDGKREMGQVQPIEESEHFTSVVAFLKQYGKALLAHDKQQAAAVDCDAYMSKIQVCKQCTSPSYMCRCPQLQSDVDVVYASENYDQQYTHWQPEPRVTSMWYAYTTFLYVWSRLWLSVCKSRIASRWFSLYFRSAMLRKFTYWCVSKCAPGSTAFEVMGVLNEIPTAPPTWGEFASEMKIVVGVMSAAAVLYCAYKGRSGPVAESSAAKKEEKVCVTINNNFPPSYGVQGNKYQTTEDQLEKEETQNVWYNPTVELTTFDMPVASTSLASKSKEELRDILARNLVRLDVVATFAQERVHTNVCGVLVSSQYLLCNAHAFKKEVSHWEVTLLQQSLSDGVTSNLTFDVHESEIVIWREQDLCLLKATNVPPVKDVLKFWLDGDITVTKMMEFYRRKELDVHVREVYGVDFVPQMPVPALASCHPVYMGQGLEDTQAGDCGALGVAETPLGPVIVGLHMLGKGRSTGVRQIKKTTIEQMMNELDERDVYPMRVQGGGRPSFESHGIVKKLGDLHHRALVRYLQGGTVNVYGTFEGFRASHRSKVCDTPLKEEMEQHFDYVADHGKPVMKGWLPWRNNIQEMVKPHCKYDRPALVECARCFVRDIATNLPEGWESQLVTLSKEAAVNGLPGVKFIDGINRSSSMGFPWNTTKKKYLVANPTEKYPDGVDFDNEFWERFDRIHETYSRGGRVHPVFSGALKDTPTPFAKIKKAKTRVFTGGPVDWSTYVRSRLLSFVRLVQKNKFVFEAGPGTVCQSAEWTDFYTYLTAFGEDRIVAGDYGKYDKRMIADFIMMAFQIIAQLHKVAGFSDEECQIIMGIGVDVAFPLCNLDGTLYEFFGTNPSGHPLTVIINSIVNALYMRYCYIKLNPNRECASFKQNVHLMTYGDDNAMGVSPERPWFNHTAIQAVLADIGVEYTMADKESESVPFINISEVSFLKREWRWEEELRAHACPLDENSIKRSLTVWLPSKTVDKHTQMIDVMISANNEFFFHGRETFEKHHAKFREILAREPYCLIGSSKRLPTWSELKDRFDRATASTKSETMKLPEGVVALPVENELTANEQQEEERIAQSVDDITESMSTLPEVNEPWVAINNSFDLDLQSEESTETEGNAGGNDAVAAAITESQTVTFIDNAIGQVETAADSDGVVADVDGTEDLQLGSFLARPTLIYTTSWTTSTSNVVMASMQPWQMFLASTAIRGKINNFAFLRGKLHIKAIVNGTPFQYGLVRVCYAPMEGFTGNKVRTNPTTDTPLKVPYSQQPGFFITPAANAGGEMELPFVFHKNWLDITNSTEVANMGTLRLVLMWPLGVAVSGGSSAVTISLYAWMTDVKLMASTSKLALQADEYTEGVISAPATAVANVARTLTHVPVIGKFARATELGARAASDIAKLFGYTNTPVIEDVKMVVPACGPQLASANIGTPVQKLTLDPKQELSIDPTPFGVSGEDELALASIKKRESYVGESSWATTDAVGTQVFTFRVNPAQSAIVGINNSVPTMVGNRVYHTPIGYYSALFQHWRGGLRLRLKIVATKFHKGRLLVQYDPRANITSSAPAENTVYTHILDIGEEDDVILEIPYHQDQGWLEVDQSLVTNWTSGSTNAPRQGTDNGTLTVRVLTSLTAPSAGSVGILAFVSGADDLEFANPRGAITYNWTGSTDVPPSFFDLQGEDKVELVPKTLVVGTRARTAKERYGMNYGECVTSLRTLLHRCSLQDVIVPQGLTTAGYNYIAKYHKIMPYTPGYCNAAWLTSASKIVAASGTAYYAFCPMHPMPFIVGPFIGYRGGANIVFTPDVQGTGQVSTDIRVSRATGLIDANTRTYYVWTEGAADSVSTRQRYQNLGPFTPFSGLGGSAIASTYTNNSVSFGFPDFKQFNFSIVNPNYYLIGSSNDGTDKQYCATTVNVKAPTTAPYVTATTYVGAAADFTAVFFLCCPTLDVSFSIPAAT